MKAICLAVALLAFVTGCATYTENGLFGGFSDTPLASDTYRIHANGNAYTSRSKTNAIAMVRAAQLALEHGYDRFVVLDYDEWAKTSYYTSPTTATTNSNTNTNLYARGSAYSVGNYQYGNIYGNADSRTTSTTTTHHGQTHAIEKPRTDIVVRFIPNDSPEASRALRVEDIIARYGKVAGYKPKETPSYTRAVSSTPAQAAPLSSRQPQADAHPATPMAPAENAVVPINPPATQTSSVQRERTLEQIYESLSDDEKFIADSMSPTDRVGYLFSKR